MGLIVNNRATATQMKLLKELGYGGSELNSLDAELVIDDLIKQQERDNRDPIYDDPLERYKVIPIILIKEAI
jgi:hypothetical protein